MLHFFAVNPDNTKNASKRKRTALFVLGPFLVVLLTLLVILQSSNLWKTLAVESASDTLLLYALSSLNFFAFIIFGFIFLRNLVKLTRERRSLQLGSKFKSRLWFYFVVVSILPIVAMAVFSYLFMNRAIERWFTQIPEAVVREARDVQDRALYDQSVKLRETAAMVAVAVEDAPDSELGKIARAGNLAHIEVVAANGVRLAAWEGPTEEASAQELLAVIALAKSGRLEDPMLTDGKGFDAAVAELSRGRRLILVPHRFGEDDVSLAAERSLAEFDKLKEKQSTVRQIGFSTLGVLTFLLIFASSWIAFYVARGLTGPIRALAEGADEIAHGKFGHRVEVLAEDELGLLVDSFNQMAERLESSSVALEERRRYIETVLESLSTGVVSFDGTDSVSTINKAAVQMLKLEEGDFRGFSIAQLFGGENASVIERLLGRSRRIGFASENLTLKADAADGSVSHGEGIQVALTASALPRSESGPSGVVLVIEDLSELIAAQRASAWQEVARRMAHEIKNPLTPIQLSAERIAKRFQPQGVSGEGQPSNFVVESTDTILREVQTLKAMVDEFSRFARLPDVRLERGDLNDVVTNAAAVFEGRGIDLRLELAPSLPSVNLDQEQLKRVFVNLVENSIEAISRDSERKQVRVSTSYDKGREVILAEVADNGPGIPPTDFRKLFQPYFSTKGRGTGLGLAIVQRIVSEHGGRIKAANIPTGGAKFVIELPFHG
jgi:nitrogen fixation/metabolism regulation signal transduction histidine kinase